MNSSIISQVARPTLSAVSKRSMVRTFSSSRVSCFSKEEPKFQLEKTHHQVAPLTDSTLYAPQGHAASTSAAAEEATIFTPSVNAVFDD